MKNTTLAAVVAAIAPVSVQAATACEDMPGAAPEGVTITEAIVLPEGDDQSGVAQCVLRGTMAER